MLVRNYMSSAPVTIRSDVGYGEAFKIMQGQHLHHLPVIDQNEKVVGILTRRDLQLAAQHFKEAPVEVSEVMHTPVVTISPDESLSTAARQMVEKQIGGLPVMDAGGAMVGILTETDLLRALTDVLDK